MIVLFLLGWGYAQPAWVDSGAPIGDSSVYVYTGTWAGQELYMRYGTTNQDTILVNNLTGAGLTGFHVYRVNSNPNYTTNLPAGTIRNGVYWGVFPVGNTTAGYDVSIHYGTNSNLDAANEPGIQVYNRNANDVNSWSTLGGTLDMPGNNVTFSFTGREEFILDNIIVLPVEGLRLWATTAPGGQVSLTWTADHEQHTESYVLEYSTDTRHYQPLVQKAAAGYSDSPQSYRHTYVPTQGGRLYYRVQQLDLDGAVAYSNVATVQLDSQQQIAVFPSPLADRLCITTALQDASPLVIALHDVQGRQVVYREVSLLSGQLLEMNTTLLSAGAYHLTVASQQGQLLHMQKVIKY